VFISCISVNPNQYFEKHPFSDSSQAPYIALAPMEGLMDFHLRELLTSVGGIDHCVTEFVRVSQNLLPRRVFYRYCPELENGGKTRSGVPVHIQLLGSDPELMAANARKAAQLGAPAIDLNFGCPAKTVNKSQGGAVLLRDPYVLERITSAVRKAVPEHIPVSAKMRLGYEDKSLALENAEALAESGISWLTVHARTKVEGYKPPAHWEWIGKIREIINIPIIANGEIWSPEDASNCQQASRSNLLMIGRGLVSIPDLAMQIKAAHRGEEITAMNWREKLELFVQLAERLPELTDKQLTDRLKQWLHYFSGFSPEIQNLFDEVKRCRQREEFFETLNRHTSTAER
ncbi:MAG: tRNA dihydrouridine synthase, partial [Oceanobacter sp.]